MINRRIALERITLLLGGVISTSLRAAILRDATQNQIYIGVSASQISQIAELADVIIPSTNTPSAKAANVQDFIVKVLQDCYPIAIQEVFYSGLEKLNAESKSRFGNDFVTATIIQKNDLVKEASVNNFQFFKLAKELTVSGYFTSEIGATQALEYLPVPGKYIGCLPLNRNQKAWAT